MLSEVSDTPSHLRHPNRRWQVASGDSGAALHTMAEEDRRIESIMTHLCVLAAEKRVAKVQRFRKEMENEIEKAKQEQRMQEDLAVKLVNVVRTGFCVRPCTVSNDNLADDARVEIGMS